MLGTRAVIVLLVSNVLIFAALTPACVPQFSPVPTPHVPAPGRPAPPDIDATLEAKLEALVTERVREALAALPTITPAPTATPIPTSTPVPLVASPPAAGESDGAVTVPFLMPEGATLVPAEPASPGPTTVDLAGMVDQVKPGVVRVGTAGGVGSGIIFEKLQDGTGLVLTNYHVVRDSYRIDVLVGDSRTFRAHLVGFDQRRDLAVLEMCCYDFSTLELNVTAGISAGSEVVAIGYALGLTGDATVTRGIVSAVRYHTGMGAWVIQTDASINPGNSGGPLLLPTGEVIGITTFLQNQDNRGNPTAGLGFAISERSIRGLLPDLKMGARNVLAAATPHTANRPGESMEWHTYTNDTHHYTVDVPEGWLVDDSDRDRVNFYSPNRFSGLAIRAYDQRVDSVDQWIDDVVAQHTSYYRGRFQLVERETSAEGEGDRVAYVVFRARVSRQFCLLRVTEVFQQSSAGSFVASFHVCEHSYSGYSAIQQAVLSSIKLP